MKIREILTEDMDIEDIIMRDCSKWIGETGGSPVWRGMVGAEKWPEPMRKLMCPVNRSPRNTDYEMHVMADDWFESATGIKFRSNAFFTTGSKGDATSYGFPLIIMPIGDYNYCWATDICDLYMSIEETVYDDEETAGHFITKILENGDYFFNRNLDKAIRSGNEIMINCKEAYLAKPGSFDL